jgi:hypothetical protein
LSEIAFDDYWNSNFPGCPPVSYDFKWRLQDRWFRFHSLPDSKRYADNKAEIEELLMRQNTVLLDVIGKDAECVLVAGDWSESADEVMNYSECPILARFMKYSLPSISKQDFDPEPEDDDFTPVYLRLAYGHHTLQEDSLNEVLLCVADEQISNFFVVDFNKSRIFAPYDGGVDIVLRNNLERDEFRDKYSKWLSKRPDGL